MQENPQKENLNSNTHSVSNKESQSEHKLNTKTIYKI